MSKLENTLKKWSVVYARPVKLNQNKTVAVNALVVTFLVMAVLQLASFNEFKVLLSGLGFSSSPESWAIAAVIAEAWAAVGLLGVRMNGLMRVFGRMFAILASGFWFLTSLQAVTAVDTPVGNMGFFGKYLAQTPGWWTVLEATAFMFWTIYVLEVTKKN